MPGNPAHPEEAIPDVSAAYHLWDELFAFQLRLACSTENGTPEEQQAAWERLLRGHQRSLAERDAMWVRIAAYFDRGRDSQASASSPDRGPGQA